jgi:release factor glutamine methyltransferase
MTLKELKQRFIEELQFLYDADETEQLFYLAVDHVSGMNRIQTIFNADHQIESAQYNSYQRIQKELKEGIPLQYITGKAWFCGLKFKVNGSVLIPRPETEELVQWILETASGVENSNLIDIGTGSGCIAVTLKNRMSGLQVDALDISADALSVAKENAMANAAKVNFIQSDILGYESPTQYDFIVSNPPYITEEERGEMHRNVLSYEPGLALFVSNENPLIFYKSIADFAVRNLRRTGYLFFEINEYLSKETIDMLTDKGFINIELKSDMQGKDRMIRCRLSVRPGDGIR